MDILVHSSRREGLARALVQGSLAGKPVIGYDVDGNREAMEHGRGGYVIKMFHVEHFGKVLGDLLRDADLRGRMGEAGRQFALRRFDVQVIVSAAAGTAPNDQEWIRAAATKTVIAR